MYLNDFLKTYNGKKNVGQATRNIYQGECVSLFSRYAYEVLNVGVLDSVGDVCFGGGKTSFPGAKHFWLNFEKSDLPKWFDKVPYSKGMKVQAGDVFVEDGNYGHIGMALGGYDGSGYDVIDQNGKVSRGVAVYKRAYKSNLFGFLRPKPEYSKKLFANLPQPVDRNEAVNQIENTTNLNVRNKPNGDRVNPSGQYLDAGYYNVIQIFLGDDYTWYEIEKDRWVAGVKGVIYLPSSKIDYKKMYEELKIENEKLLKVIEDAKTSSLATTKILDGSL